MNYPGKSVLSNLAARVLPELFRRNECYAQFGEDLQIAALLGKPMADVSYIDIGANDPVRFSNTYLFSSQGASGICVEPNPAFGEDYKRCRSRDVFLNVGISSTTSSKQSYYVMDWHEFNTFSKEQAIAVQQEYQGRNNIREEVQIEVLSVSDFLSEYRVNDVDLLSLDVEGMDLSILESWDFDVCCPKIICVEIKDLKTGEVDSDILRFLSGKGYRLLASNPINGIFVAP